MTIQAPVFVTPLKDLCIKVVAANFEYSPSFGNLPDKFIKKIIDNLPLDLPLELVGTVITDEDYWKRRACARWKNCEASAHGNSWRQLYFERNIQDVLEQFDVSSSDITALRRLMTYSRRYVQTINLRQLPSHLDLQVMFDCMVNSPSSLAVTYGLMNVGMDYDRSLFGMKLSDCRCLARALEHAETLTYLDLSNNSLDDDKIRMLASGLVENISVTHLNLTHNKIADRGVRALSKLLDSRSVIAILELGDNAIHTEGAKSLAKALKTNQSLLSLNLRLNRMGDDGCKAICDALVHNTGLERLDISANAGAGPTSKAIANLLSKNHSLTELNISCNNFGVEGGLALRKALESNHTMQMMDMRTCHMSPEDELSMIENLRLRQEKRDKAKLLARA